MSVHSMSKPLHYKNLDFYYIKLRKLMNILGSTNLMKDNHPSRAGVLPAIVLWNLYFNFSKCIF